MWRFEDTPASVFGVIAGGLGVGAIASVFARQWVALIAFIVGIAYFAASALVRRRR
jgi:hypothetical protein